jgi:thioredoxin-related protein
MKSLLAFIFLFSLTTPEWLTNFDDAKKAAATEHKHILLSFSGSDWCGPCIKMKKEVFESDAFSAIAEKKLILVRADFPRSKKNQLPKDQAKRNESLAERFNPEGKFPFTLLLDKDGDVIKRWDGYVFSSQDKFMEDLQVTLASTK